MGFDYHIDALRGEDGAFNTSVSGNAYLVKTMLDQGLDWAVAPFRANYDEHVGASTAREIAKRLIECEPPEVDLKGDWTRDGVKELVVRFALFNGRAAENGGYRVS